MLLWIWAASLATIGCDQGDYRAASAGASASNTPSAAAVAERAGAASAPEPADSGPTAAEIDERALELLDDDDESRKVEARAWLKQPDSRVWEGSKEATIQFVDQMYGAGAPKVWAAGVIDDEEWKVSLTSMFVVELPNDKAARQRIFNAYNTFISGGQELSEDEKNEYGAQEKGQKYLVLEYD
jgi:hypothetical protein